MKPITLAYRRARQIPSGKKTPAKCKAVHKWVEAIKVMLSK
jgi:DNA-directed RNA polymerase subunit K/omega